MTDDFWDWVSSEIKANATDAGVTKKTLIDMIDEELKGAEKGYLIAMAKGNERGKAYWEGYKDALTMVKNAILKGVVKV